AGQPVRAIVDRARPGPPTLSSGPHDDNLPARRAGLAHRLDEVAVLPAGARNAFARRRMVHHDAQPRTRRQLLERELGLDERVGTHLAREVQAPHHATILSDFATSANSAASSSASTGTAGPESRTARARRPPSPQTSTTSQGAESAWTAAGS